MNGPFRYEEVRTFTNGDLIAIKDATNVFPVAYAQHEANAKIIVDALNNYFDNNTRRKDPQTSRDAEMSMSKMMRNQYRRLAYELFTTKGPMSDERLYDEFCESQVKITEARVRHIRLELVKLKLIEPKRNLTARTRQGCECTVYGLVAAASQAAHD